MKNWKRISTFTTLVILAVFATVAAGCGGGGGGGGAIDDGGSTETKEWTFMVYLCADNNLEYFDYLDIKEMEQVGSNDNVNIIVQWDRTGNDSSVDWAGCRRYYINKDENNSSAVVSTAVQVMGDVNMGSPTTLSDFITWGMTNYPAEKYAVILWDHGSGWRGRSWGDAISKDICMDDTSGDVLTQAELRTAFSQVTSGGSSKIEILGFDACLMAMTEVVYDVKAYGNYAVASEALIPGRGWPYTPILQNLTANPTQGGASFGAAIVNAYANYYSSDDTTLSSVDLTKMDALAVAVNNFANQANAVMATEGATLKACCDTTQNYDSGYSDFRDLGVFAEKVQAQATDADLQNTAAALATAVSNAVAANGTTGSYSNSRGLTIWLPNSLQYANYEATYKTLQLSQDTSWDEFLANLVQQ